ncbi:DUF167 family protein [Pikeienuella sp. HZG-20]|uniref:DUF167 family protein n=1 Tax=Paludibacillus litoralis TaxID=3133267 RepID=UPI0030EB6F0B
MSAPPPWSAAPGGLLLNVRLTPKGGRDRIFGVSELPESGAVLLVRVSAAPVDGAANAALIRLIAKTAGVAKSAVALVSGPKARVKRLMIEGEAAAIEARLRRALEDGEARRAT